MAQVIPIGVPEAPQLAVDVLESGGLIVLPTDTVYGVGCALDEAALTRLFAAKQRPPERAVPVLLSGAEQADRVAAAFPAAAHRLAAAFWPGPLTLVVPKRADLPPNLSTLPTVGVRVPDHAGARTIIAAGGGALAVTSANRSDAPPACTVQAAIAALADRVGLYLDGGECPGGTPSTVAAVEGETVRVLREGPLDAAALRAALGA